MLNNSIRFRLKQPGVEYFSHHKSITEVLDLGPVVTEQLSFRLIANNENEFSITYSEQTVQVNIPHQLAQEWTLTDLIGIEEAIIASNGKGIKVVVEKDFTCLHKKTEGNENAYPNPNEN